jgi:VIT1/CCC1 family predicted Fe2+/Mn2+ transporter
MAQKFNPEIIRSFTFGVEDSLVSTVGLVSGIAVAGTSRETILLTGLVLIFVEAFSMGVGELLSDNSAQEYAHKKYVALSKSFFTALVMFFSYLAAGLVVIGPYLFFENSYALSLSLSVTFIALFLLGLLGGFVSRTSMVHRGLLMILVGGFAVIVGVVVGILVQ